MPHHIAVKLSVCMEYRYFPFKLPQSPWSIYGQKHMKDVYLFEWTMPCNSHLCCTWWDRLPPKMQPVRKSKILGLLVLILNNSAKLASPPSMINEKVHRSTSEKYGRTNIISFCNPVWNYKKKNSKMHFQIGKASEVFLVFAAVLHVISMA